MNTYQGGCLCGRIRFVATGEPRFPHTCSCSQCQRHSGSLTLCWVEFDKAAVSWVGEGGMPSLYRSSEDSCRAFCPSCGSSLGAIDNAPTVGLLLGCFDSLDALALRPSSHSFADGRPSWWQMEC
ncbi:MULTISPECIES: GFA family protein [unclassified Pseudomonas]|uniref:GFA family protein n=1 Tax=unclassified Pseudomonas TaxID=196821 RepID=UPI00244D4455|nr:MULTISPECIES: GFA family protein [unclassified Pseudomonas]MDH0300792.1 GFA family protein [Pseudomonas sp. GD04091]MDH1984996.1 GFA family protein [Pseudomonas sp. GD03689]